MLIVATERPVRAILLAPFALALISFVLLSMIGCGGSPTTEPKKPAAETEGNEEASTATDGSFVLGDLIEPFDPPTLEEIDATADWQDRPVVDALQKLLDKQAGEPEPIAEKEALTLKNESLADNEKILNSLGRMRIVREGEFYDDEPGIDWDAEIVRYAPSDITSSNGILTSSITESEVNSLTSFGLFSFDWNLIPHASADSVVSWQTSKDGMMDKVVIRDDLTWSDGKPITAHDIVFSFKVIMSSQVPVPAMRQGTDEIRWIEAYDDHTLVYFQKKPLATNVWNLNFYVIPKHIYAQSIADDPQLSRSPYHVKYEDEPVFGGAYNITKRKRGQEILLRRRESFYMHNGKQVRDKPFFKTVRFKVIPDQSVGLLALRKGDLDEMVMFDTRLWTNQTIDDDFYRRNTKVQARQWLTWSFQWNLKTPLFSDLRVREAMGYAFDHEEMLANLRFGLDIPGIGTYHPDSPWCSDPPPEPQKQDLAKARKLLNAAGWRDTDGDGVLDKDGLPFEFSIICRNQQWRADICTLLAENLERLGVLCNVQPLEATVVQKKLLDHQFQAAFGGWSTGADPYTSENIFGTDKGRNFGHYSNPDVDRLFDEAKKQFDFAERQKRYQQIHQILWDDKPYTWLFHQSSFYAFNKKLRGYSFSPRGPYAFGPGFSSIYQPARP